MSYLTSSNLCATTSTFDVTIINDEDGSFSYNATEYCQSGSDPTPTVTGTTGGSFSSGSGLAINSSTGQIDLSASTTGIYTVSYLTSSNLCAVTGTFILTITADEVANISYNSVNYCQSDADPTPSITGVTGGTFSSSSGLSINSSSGKIDVSASNPGTYTVSYLSSSNTCATISTFDVTIIEDEDGSFTYASTEYCKSGSNPTPTITGTAGGSFSSGSGLAINSSTGQIDLASSTTGIYTISYLTSSNLYAVTGTFIVTITADEVASISYNASNYCQSDSDPTPSLTGVTGGTFSSTSGLSINPSTGAIDVSASTPGSYTVSYLSSSNLCATTATTNISITADEDGSFTYTASEYCKSDSDPTPTITGTTGGSFSSGSGLAINPTTGQIDIASSTTGIYTVSYLTSSNQCAVTGTFSVTITADEVASISYNASNYCQSDSDPTPSITGVTGGIFSSTLGLIINSSTGAINLGASTPGSYTVSYLSSSNLCATTATTSVSITADEDGSFTYASSEYCKSGSTNPNNNGHYWWII